MKIGGESSGARELWNMAPGALAAALLLFGFVPIGVGVLVTLAPMLVVMAVYYWSIYRPKLMPPWFAFLLGLLHDLMSGGPLGLTALLLLALRGLGASQRRMFVSRSFVLNWWGFALAAFASSLVFWVAISIYHVRLLDPTLALLQCVLASALYPGVTWVFNRTERLMPREI
jgi:rod shape-determining protein MreD